MLVVRCRSRSSRRLLAAVRRYHDETIVERSATGAMLLSTHWGLFTALRLRERDPEGTTIEATVPLEEAVVIPEAVERAAVAYERRQHRRTPYAKFAAGKEYPLPETMKRRWLTERR